MTRPLIGALAIITTLLLERLRVMTTALTSTARKSRPSALDEQWLVVNYWQDGVARAARKSPSSMPLAEQSEGAGRGGVRG